jgi:hypothetical protein
MKLRNKKTGEVVVEVNKIGLVWNRFGMPADIGQYDSLAELNEEWEDYAPKEPRINNEDARDAVYSWALSLQVHEVRCKKTARGVEVITFEAFKLMSAPKIEFACYSIDANVTDGKIYTIEELCGEEEALEPIEPTFIDLDERVKEKRGE